MSRKNKTYRNFWKTDTQYNSLLVGRFIGQLMQNGKRTTAERIIYEAFDIIHEKTNKGGLNIFEQAIKNISPLMELKGRRIGGANYQVPVPVSGDRRITLAMRWILAAAKSKKGQKMAGRLAEELLDATNKTGTAMKKREDTHRMAEANKAFAHFA